MISGLLEQIEGSDGRENRAHQMRGVCTAIVTKNNDEEKLGRVKVTFPWMSDDNETDWIRVATLMAGAERGSYFIPEVDDEVLVAFVHGDINRPIVIGSLWGKEDKPKEKNDEEKNHVKKYTSRQGHELIFDDNDTKGKLEIHTNAGHTILLDDASGGEKILIKDKTESNFVEIDSVKNSISVESAMEISIKSTNITIDASGMMKIKSGGMMNIEAGGVMALKGAVINLN